jgi:hypothetical protein
LLEQLVELGRLAEQLVLACLNLEALTSIFVLVFYYHLGYQVFA